MPDPSRESGVGSSRRSAAPRGAGRRLPETFRRPALKRDRHPARDLVTLFLFLILLGTALLHLPVCAREGSAPGTIALFTATSAVCVTGLVVVDTAAYWTPAGQAVLLLLIQAGGLGYMTASSFLVLVFRRQPDLNERLLLREALGEVTLADTLKLFAGAVRFALAVEAIGALLLVARFLREPDLSPGEAAWRGVFHSVSAFCNAGFDLFGRDGHRVGSLGGYAGDAWVNLTVAALIVVGGLGYPVCVEIARRRPNGRFSLHTRIVLVSTGALILFGWVMVLVTEWTNPNTLHPMPLGDKVLAGFFQSVTARTAGFATVDFGALRSITLMFTGLLMAIGASPGGTGGGIKTTSFAVILLAMRASLRGHHDIEVFGRRISPEQLYRTVQLFILSVGTLIGGTLLLAMTEPAAIAAGGIRDNLFVRIQFEAVSAFATVGLSTGITPLLTETGRLIVIAMMFVGRIGPVTLAAAWTAPGSTPKRRLPEERVALG